MRKPSLCCACCVVVALVIAARAGGVEIVVEQDGPITRLSLDGGTPFHATAAAVTDARLILLAGSPAVLALWDETGEDGAVVPHYAVSMDGAAFSAGRPALREIALAPEPFDPAEGVPPVPDVLAAGPDTNVYIVQFVTQPLAELVAALGALGATAHGYLPNQAYVAAMGSAVRQQGWLTIWRGWYDIMLMVHGAELLAVAPEPRTYA